MSRRDFVGVAAATGVALGVGTNAARAVESGSCAPRNIKKSLKWGMIGVGSTVLEKFQAAKEAGFHGVELDSPGAPNLDEVRAAMESTGLAVPGVVDSEHWRSTLSHPDASVRDKGRAALETALHDCKAVGGTTVLLVPAVVNRDVTYADAYRRSQEEIRKVLPLAEELGIGIAIENVWNSFLLSPLEAARYIDEFESKWIGWYFDVGNIVNYGWPHHWVEALGHRIMKLDIKEFSRKKRNDEGLWKGFGVKIGDGDCDWPLVMKALDDIGYSGWASAEVGGGDLNRLKEISERMDRVFAM